MLIILKFFNFVKDTTNLLDYNIWSGTDYNQNSSGFTIVRCTAESNNNWSTIGESSLKITTNDSANWSYVDACRLTGATGTINTTLDVYAPKGGINIVLYAGCNISSVSVPANDIIQKISLSGTLPSSYNYLAIRMFPRDDNVPYYVDNIIVS